MNQKTIFIIAILGVMLLSSTALAAVSSVSTVLSTTRATTGTSVTATTTVTATGSESGSIQLICSPSGTTISDPSSGQYQGVSLSTTPTSKTFTFTAGTANTYTCNGQSGGVSDTAPPTIVFVNPSALTVTGTPTSKSVSASGDSFTLTANIQNSQASAITTSYSLSLPSGYSSSGDSTSTTITVSAGSTTSLTWNVTTGSSSGTITLSLGDNTNAFSSSVTVPAATTTTTTAAAAAAAGATTGVKVTTQKGKATITVPSIAAGKSATVDIAKTEDLAFRKVVVSVKNSVNNIQVTVTKLADKPATITQEISGKVYHYVQVDKNVSDADVNQTAIRFEVEKSWISANNINKSTITLFRHENNAWNKLQTTELSDDANNILYEAISPGLSVFAIASEAKIAAPVAAPAEEKAAEKPAEEKPAAPIEAAKKSRGMLVTIIIIVVIAAGVIFMLVKKNVIKLGTTLKKKENNWDELKRKYRR